MSRNPSPAAPPTTATSSRGKQKALPGGINAGAEDVKYQAKYKELKRKVKEIELENDKLLLHVMHTKLAIQRMKMERAILYERLAPPSPTVQDRAAVSMAAPSGLPPHQPLSAGHHHREVHDHSAASAEPDQSFPAYQEYNSRSRGTPSQPVEGRPVSALEAAPPQGVAISPHMPRAHSPREHEPRHRMSSRHLSANVGPYEGHPSRSHSSSHTSPPVEHDYPSQTHHIRTRSQSSSRSRSHQVPTSSYREGQYPEMQPQAFSPPLSDQERSRHSDMRNLPTQGEPHGHPHHAQLSPRSANSDLRSRMHPHQRVGPGTYINRDEYSDRQRDLDREREWEHERASRDLARNRDMPPAIHSPHSVHRPRQPMERTDYADHHMSSARDEQPQFYDGAQSQPRTYPLVSRSGTPGSASASGSGAGHNEDSSRPDSRSQYYEQQDRGRPSSYRLRPVGQPGQEDIDFAHEDARGAHPRTDRAPGGGGNFPLPEQNLPSQESRKRSRNEMDVDSENDVVDSSRGAGLYSSSRTPVEDRGSKRYHRERPHRRSMDAHEDNRVVPS